VEEDDCWGDICVTRTDDWKGKSQQRLEFQGEVKGQEKDDCRILAGVRIEIWQADLLGRYASIHNGVENGYCHNVFVSDKKGHFEFDTERPGSSGLLGGQGPFHFDLPPYRPQHLSLFFWKPGYIPLTTEFFFSDDLVGRKHDWNRDKQQKFVINSEGVLTDEDSLVLHLEKHPKKNNTVIAHKTVILKRDIHQKYVGLTAREAMKKATCRSFFPNFDTPLSLCFPFLTYFLHLKMLVLIFISAILILSYLLQRYRRSRTSTHKIITFRSQTSPRKI